MRNVSISYIQIFRQGKIITTAQLSLMQSGFSRRAWADLPEDIYKANGRVRHEFINIHIGALAAMYDEREKNTMQLLSIEVYYQGRLSCFIEGSVCRVKG